MTALTDTLPAAVVGIGRGSPGGGGRALRIAAIPIVALLVALAAALGIVTVQHWAGRAHEAEVLLARLDGQVDRLHSLHERVLDNVRAGTLSPEDAENQHDRQRQFANTLVALARLEPGGPTAGRIRDAYRAYEAAVDEAVQLGLAGQVAEAQDLHRERVDSGFAALTDAIANAGAANHDSAGRARALATGGSIGAMLLATVGIGLLCWLFERTRRTAHLMATEQRALRWSEERFRALVQNASDAIFILAADGTVRYQSPSAEQMLAYQAQEVIAKNIAALLHPDDVAAIERLLAGALRQPGRNITCEARVRHADGTWLQAEAISTNLLDTPAVAGVVVTIRDIRERKDFEARLVHLASHDALTGLFNRRRFEEEVAHQLAQAQRFGTRGALLFLDLDNFKRVNDSLGHRAGDELLCSVAGLLRESLREADVVARLGGDEFAVFLSQADGARAEAAAEQLLQAARGHTHLVGEQVVGTTLSIGIALVPDHGTTVEELLVRADLAMYEAKDSGRNGVCVYAPDRGWEVQLGSRFAWEQRIRDALAQGRFVLHAQPIQQMHLRGIDHYEVLLRMVSEDGELILPGAFLDVAERSGLIRAIDRWVVRQAIHLIAAQRRAHRDVCLEVNLSGKSLGDGELLALIERELAVTGVDPANLVLEITETAAITELTKARKFIDRLKGLGCRFALDDFGVGFSSFSHLKHLPVDYLKLDGSFIRDLAHDSVDQQLVKAMVAVAHGLGKQTIAEFVGDAETVALLREYGVDYAQGYYVGRPGPVAEILAVAAEVKPGSRAA